MVAIFFFRPRYWSGHVAVLIWTWPPPAHKQTVQCSLSIYIYILHICYLSVSLFICMSVYLLPRVTSTICLICPKIGDSGSSLVLFCLPNITTILLSATSGDTETSTTTTQIYLRGFSFTDEHRDMRKIMTIKVSRCYRYGDEQCRLPDFAVVWGL